ncbi:MAG: macro domain-containing protein [Alphaproteobacteria bacterium]|nr:macro domain-containing protein [Alphaproteobacteria bacterium]
MFKALIGDLFASKAQTLVNTVNCVGIMGKGVAEQFKIRFPRMFEDYKARCDIHAVKLGEPYLYRDLSGTSIVNFPTKDHWKSSSRLKDIEAGLDFLVAHIQEWRISSIAIPPLGCGNGGLEWSEVGPLIYQKLSQLPIEVEVYAPYGTPPSQITNEFLSAPSQMSLEGKGRRHAPLKPEWVVVMEVLRELEVQRYASPVGRTIFQKICYVLTEMGVPTGFQFEKGSYGPYADSVKSALHNFANRNWVHEERLGRMLALKIDPQYQKDRGKYVDLINEYKGKIAKTVDLFSRIKDTEQAEEVLTVLFASRQIKLARPTAEVTEDDLYGFIVDWKKAWAKPEKKAAVSDAIRSLAVLGWLRVKFSDSALEAFC